MAAKDKKNPISRFICSPLFLIIGIPLAALLAFTYVRSYYNNYKVDQEIASLQQEIASLEYKKLESMDILNYVMSKDFVEEKARTELNMKREGENVVVFKSDNKDEDDMRSNLGDSGQNISNPLKWWYYFTNKALPINKQN
ncbi:MAG: septum formation initiator family protein [bacterium]|nr:septum formation initiator family protein [bacterium]